MTARLHRDFLTIPLAHRGLHDPAHGIIENSASAVQAAVDAGFGIEIDIQRSADGLPMVFHDYRLDRLTSDNGSVFVRTARDLAGIMLTGSKDSIRPLAEILDIVKGRVPLLVEIKDQDGALGPDVGSLHAEVAETLAGYRGPVAVMSFNPHTMRAFARNLPECARGLVTDAFTEKDWPHVPAARRAELAEIPDADDLALDFISHNVNDLKAVAVARQKDAGRAVFCWTVRSAEVEADARAIADNITFEGYLPAGR